MLMCVCVCVCVCVRGVCPVVSRSGLNGVKHLSMLESRSLSSVISLQLRELLLTQLLLLAG